MKAGQKQTGKTDTVLWVLVLILVVLGLGALFSASEYNGRVRFHDSAYYFKKQLFATVLGLLVMYLASRVDYRLSVKLAPAAYIFSLFSVCCSPAFRTGDQWIEEVAEPGAAFLSAVGVFQGGSDIVSGVADQQYKKQNNRILVYLQDYDDFASGSRSGGLQ